MKKKNAEWSLKPNLSKLWWRITRRPWKIKTQWCCAAIRAKEVSQALGFGFRCGFLGLLHMEIVPRTSWTRIWYGSHYNCADCSLWACLKDGTVEHIENPSKLPDLSKIIEVREPMISATILVPHDYVGNVMTLCNQKQGNANQYAIYGGVRSCWIMTYPWMKWSWTFLIN